MKRSQRPRNRFSLSPLITAIGCGMSYLLLTYLLPRVWAAALPGGLDSTLQLRGWPRLVWQLAILAHGHFVGVCVVFAVIVLLSTLLTRAGAIGRLLAWLLAVAMVLVNGGLLYVTLRVPVDLALSGRDIGATAISSSESSQS